MKKLLLITASLLVISLLGCNTDKVVIPKDNHNHDKIEELIADLQDQIDELEEELGEVVLDLEELEESLEEALEGEGNCSLEVRNLNEETNRGDIYIVCDSGEYKLRNNARLENDDDSE